MSKYSQAIEKVFPDGVMEDPSENEAIIAELAEKNEALLAVLHESLTDIHWMDRRIPSLLSDMAEWNHDGDVKEAQAIFGRNECILDQVVDLIVEHIAIAQLSLGEIETAFNKASDRSMKNVLNAIYVKKSDATIPELADLFQQALGINIDLGRLNDNFEPYGFKDLNPTVIRGLQSDLNPTDLSPENIKTVGLLVNINSIALEEINGELNNPTAASAAVIGDANNSGVDCSDEHIALASPNQGSGLCESQPGNKTNGAAAKRKRKSRKHEEPAYRYILASNRIPKHWQEIHVQLWRQATPRPNKRATGKAPFTGKVTIESRIRIITEDGVDKPKRELDSFLDFTKQDSFRRTLNGFRNKWAKNPKRLIDDPWYKELNQFILWLNQFRKTQGLVHEALVSTAHIRVPRTKAEKQGSGKSHFQYDLKHDEHVAAIMLRNDMGIPVRLILLHGRTGYEFTDVWEADGKEGSSDWRATWKGIE